MDNNETYDAVFNFMVDTLTDMADADDEDLDEVRDDMASIVSVLMDGLSFEVVSNDGDVVIAKVKVT